MSQLESLANVLTGPSSSSSPSENDVENRCSKTIVANVEPTQKLDSTDHEHVGSLWQDAGGAAVPVKQDNMTLVPDDIMSKSDKMNTEVEKICATANAQSPTRKEQNSNNQSQTLGDCKQFEIRLSRLPAAQTQSPQKKETVSEIRLFGLPAAHTPSPQKKETVFKIRLSGLPAAQTPSPQKKETVSKIRLSGLPAAQTPSPQKKETASSSVGSSSKSSKSSSSSIPSSSDTDKSPVKRKILPVKAKKPISTAALASRRHIIESRRKVSAAMKRTKKPSRIGSPVKIKINFLRRKLAKKVEEPKKPVISDQRQKEIDFETTERDAAEETSKKIQEEFNSEAEFVLQRDDPRFSKPTLPSTPDGSSAESSEDEECSFRPKRTAVSAMNLRKLDSDSEALKGSPRHKLANLSPKSVPKGTGRRTMMKKALVQRGIVKSLSADEVAHVSCVYSLFHEMVYYQIGDIIGLQGKHGTYFAQILNLVQLPNAQDIAEIAWLVPITYCQAYPFKPDDYERRDDIPPEFVNLDEAEFVTHFPFDYYDKTLRPPRGLEEAPVVYCRLPVRFMEIESVEIETEEVNDEVKEEDESDSDEGDETSEGIDDPESYFEALDLKEESLDESDSEENEEKVEAELKNVEMEIGNDDQLIPPTSLDAN